MTTSCYFVTGAAGFVGRHLCQRLRLAGHRVRGLSRRRDDGLEAIGVEVILGDLASPEAWQHAVAGVDYIIHCAANASFEAGGAATVINVEGTRHLLRAAQAAGPVLRRFVFVSTIGSVDRARGDDCTVPLDENAPPAPASAYGASKAQAEQLVRESGLPFCIVRPAMVVGDDMRIDSHFSAFIRKALRGSPVARFAWPGTFSVVEVDDLSAALELGATHPDTGGQTFFCAGTPVSIRDCFELARPGIWRLPIGWAATMARTFPRLTPFKLKALLLPALVANDAPLRRLGWVPRQPAFAALQTVIQRERARLDPEEDPGGQTVITGAASGLGLALVEQLSPRRRNLLLIDRDAEGLARVQARHPGSRIAVVDLADELEIARLLAGEMWQALPVREIFACAGLGVRGPMLANSAGQHARVFKVNVLARLQLVHASLPGMIHARFGRIVLISSSSAFQPLPYMASYAASNAALLLLGEAWGAEIAGAGVQMLQICPGGMQTNFHQAAGVRVLISERLMSPDEVATRIVHALTGRSRTVIISSRAFGMSVAARLLPRAVSVALWKKLMALLR